MSDDLDNERAVPVRGDERPPGGAVTSNIATQKIKEIHMEAVVPRAFASFLRQRRLTLLVPPIVISFILAVPFHLNNGFLIALAAIPGISLFNLLLTYRAPLIYVFDGNGICIREKDAGSTLMGLNGIAPRYWVDWRHDALEGVELTHWKTLPALCLSTKKRPRGKIIPLERQDVDATITYLSNLQSEKVV